MDLDAALTRSIELAAQARAAGDHPFGALLLVDGEVVAEAVNLVATNSDLTAHAETMLVRVLEHDGRLHLLANGIVVASTEPCPMCVGAMFWAGARHVVFGLSAARLNEIVRKPDAAEFGFAITANELDRPASGYSASRPSIWPRASFRPSSMPISSNCAIASGEAN